MTASSSSRPASGGWGGGAVPRPGGKTFWGGYSGIFVDPEGHPWEVAHNPSWTLGEEGSVSLS
jgi:uncharacterized protein